MSNEDSRFVSESLEALLVSIADGVREAQDVLSSAPPIDSFGRPTTTYHLPYLDFELMVDMETITKPGKAPWLKIRPRTSTEATRNVSSTISGRLVAIPPNEGLPKIVLTIASERLSARSHRILLSAVNSAGEILAGQGIELNINMDASKQLSQLEGINLTSKRSGTKLEDVILLTDANGSAETVFHIDPGLPAKAVLVLTAEIGTENASLSVSAGGSA